MVMKTNILNSSAKCSCLAIFDKYIVDWCLTPILEVFQLYLGVVKYKYMQIKPNFIEIHLKIFFSETTLQN